MATAEPLDRDADDDRAPEFYDEPWVTPPFQPIRAIGALILIACGFGLYEYVLVSFWSVPWMGIHERIPWPAFAILAAAMALSIAGLATRARTVIRRTPSSDSDCSHSWHA